ncbi:unnamed protein product [Diatraea saccharalis]|uniref:Uncharacterized protein n=1 Tax=Diatraea saccharalis TaxID=40085 RepID=A0A9N9QPG3_9NEOP|nr:unnamed protein product [Diatraea saccharalis]
MPEKTIRADYVYQNKNKRYLNLLVYSSTACDNGEGNVILSVFHGLKVVIKISYYAFIRYTQISCNKNLIHIKRILYILCVTNIRHLLNLRLTSHFRDTSLA